MVVYLIKLDLSEFDQYSSFTVRIMLLFSLLSRKLYFILIFHLGGERVNKARKLALLIKKFIEQNKNKKLIEWWGDNRLN